MVEERYSASQPYDDCNRCNRSERVKERARVCTWEQLFCELSTVDGAALVHVVLDKQPHRLFLVYVGVEHLR